MAQTVWGEARGEPRAAREGVINVIINRWLTDYRGGRTIIGVCHAHKQFSCWNDGDPNRDKIHALTGAEPLFLIILSQCASVLAGRLSGGIKSNVGEARHYHTPAVSPNWAGGQKPLKTIGNHIFYEDIS